MLCTEAEAYVKWCPHTRYLDREYVGDNNAVGGACNRNIGREGLAECQCYASHCMMWRWDDPKKETGYCGLAGRPYVYETEPTSDRT